MPSSLVVRISNAIALLIILVMVSGPIWNFIPLSLTPFSSPLGKLRLVIGIFLCHVGLIFWLVDSYWCESSETETAPRRWFNQQP